MAKEFSKPDHTNDIVLPDLDLQLDSFKSEPVSYVDERPEKSSDSPKGFVGGFFELMNEAAVIHKAEQIGGQLKDLESRLDYQKIAEDFVTGETDELAPDQLSRMMGASDLIKKGKMDLADLETADRDRASWSKNLEALGYISLDPEMQDNIQEVDEALLDRIRNELSVQVLAEKYKGNYPSLPDFQATVALHRIDMCDATEFTAKAWQERRSFYNDPMKQAIKGRLTEIAAELPAFDYELSTESAAYQEIAAEAREIDPIEAVKDLEIIGDFEEACFLNPAKIKDSIIRNIPPIASKDITQIKLVKSIAADVKEGYITAGQIEHSYEGSVISISEKAFLYDLNFLEDDPDYQQVMQFFAKKHLYHEAGHRLHRSLPVAALNRWKAATDLEQVNVTDYVEDMNKQRHLHRHREDFADSLSIYLTSPGNLKDMSPARFEAMTDIYHDFMPNFEDRLWPYIQQRVKAHERPYN